MQVTAIKTSKITAPGAIEALLNEFIKDFDEGGILVMTSKILSILEGRVVDSGVDLEDLIKQECDYYLPVSESKYGHHFTITRNSIVASAGIDHSNGNGKYILWPSDPQATANSVRKYLCERFKVKNAGVLITDSTSMPLKLGVMGMPLAFSGFMPIKSYVGRADVFNEPIQYSKANMAASLAAAAVIAMGEGDEQTPLAVINDVPFVEFVNRGPMPDELAAINVKLEDDLFAPFLLSGKLRRGGRRAN